MSEPPLIEVLYQRLNDRMTRLIGMNSYYAASFVSDILDEIVQLTGNPPMLVAVYDHECAAQVEYAKMWAHENSQVELLAGMDHVVELVRRTRKQADNS